MITPILGVTAENANEGFPSTTGTAVEISVPSKDK